MAEGFFSLTPGQADLVRVVAELQAQGQGQSGARITLEVLMRELDCGKSTALHLARSAAERGWLVLGTAQAPGLRLTADAPVERLFAHQWECGLALTGGGAAVVAEVGAGAAARESPAGAPERAAR